MCRIIRNVIRMTSSRTGIGQSSRRMMKPATGPPYSRSSVKGSESGGAVMAPPDSLSPSCTRLLDLDLGEVDLVQEVQVVRVLDRRLLELHVRVPVDRDDRHRAVLPEELLLQLAVQLVALGVVRRVARLVDELVVALVAVVRVVVARVARPLLEEVHRVDVVPDPAEPEGVDGLVRRRAEELEVL